jgi:hypothetical protein
MHCTLEMAVEVVVAPHLAPAGLLLLALDNLPHPAAQQGGLCSSGVFLSAPPTENVVLTV